jgi:hypothetical protein
MDSSRILLLRKLVAAVCDDASTAGASMRTLASAIHTNNLLVEDSTLLLPKEYPVVVGLLDQLYNGLYRRMSQKKVGSRGIVAPEGSTAHLPSNIDCTNLEFPGTMPV